MDAIVRYHSGLKQQVIELQTHLWSPDLSLNASYFEWKYERNPYLKEPLIYLAMHHGKIIGMRGFFGVQWECGIPTQRFLSLYADDMVILPEHRHRGLMSKIMTFAFDDLAAKGHKYVFNLSAGTATLRSSLSLGWRSAGWVRPMQRLPWPAARQMAVLQRIKTRPVLSGFARFLFQRFGGLDRSLNDVDLDKIKKTFDAKSGSSVEDSPRCSAMAELVSRIGGNGRIRHVRDGEYFQWRFQNPLSRYRYIYLGRDRLEAYIVLQEYTAADWYVLNIVNWEASSTEARECVLEVACKLFAKNRELIIWSASLSEPTIALLHKNGFRFLKPPENMTDFPTAILVRRVADFAAVNYWTLGGQNLLDLAAWDLQMLYSMHG